MRAKSTGESAITCYDIALALKGLIKKIICMDSEMPLHAIVQICGKDSLAEERTCEVAPICGEISYR